MIVAGEALMAGKARIIWRTLSLKQLKVYGHEQMGKNRLKSYQLHHHPDSRWCRR
jgi:hypothetical protein